MEGSKQSKYVSGIGPSVITPTIWVSPCLNKAGQWYRSVETWETRLFCSLSILGYCPPKDGFQNLGKDNGCKPCPSCTHDGPCEMQPVWLSPKSQHVWCMCNPNPRSLKHSNVDISRPSPFFWIIKRGFDHISCSVLTSLLSDKGIPHYLVSWVCSFLTKWKCHLVFQELPNVFLPVQVGTPEGCPVSHLPFMIYVSILHTLISHGIMFSMWIILQLLLVCYFVGGFVFFVFV